MTMRMRTAGFTLALLLAAGPALGQNDGQSADESMRRAEESIKAMASFVKGVTFDEKDIKTVIDNWSEIVTLGEEADSGKETEGWDEEETVDFKELLAYPAYRSWAKSKGLDPDTWLKKFMRIQALMMKEAAAGSMTQGAGMIEQQLAQLESQRAQMGEDMYRQMKTSMENQAAAMGSIGNAYKSLPDPTPAEKKLLDRYTDQLMSVMGSE